ncbi:TAXI family TRAP transporter solute-binding subunit [Aeromicrobium sp.]|uniref:TAXI family TRAP transporter solute-binding subunit n=1 Tax=Aeromicrobium sp. TaxID=1871063 RepID=UPI003C60EDE6
MKRPLSIVAVVLATVMSLTACGGQRSGSGAGSGGNASGCDAGTGRVNIATGNSTGVYYVVGGGLAKLINDETDIQARSAETGASVQNIQQLVAGDYDIAFSLADTAADAAEGKASFKEPQDISTLGRIYANYTQVVVRKDSGINSVEDFAGKTISTGSPQSGTEVIARRLIEAAGLQQSDVKAQRLDLAKTGAGMKDGSIDGLVWSGGLPTPELTDLFTSAGDDVKFIDPTPLLPELNKISDVYEKGVVPAKTYDLAEDAPSIVVPNLLLVRNDMKENLACALTTLIYGKADQLAKVHPAAKEITLDNATETDPVALHPGSERAFKELAK